MPTFARLNAEATAVLATATLDAAPDAYWRPLVEDPLPEFVSSTHRVAPSGYIIEPAQVRKTWTVEPLPPPVVPEEVTNAQLRAALIDFGVMPSTVLAAINAMPDEAGREKAKAWWEYANVMRRDNPLLNNMGALLGFTPQQIDALFILAAAQA